MGGYNSDNPFYQWCDNSPPKLYVIDEEMVIQWTNMGFTSQSQLQSKLDSL